MEAKDTVIEGKIIGIHPTEQAVIDGLLSRQAKISFKLGIKEVVEWIRNEGIDNDEFNTSEQYPLVHFRLNKSQWQTKLKEWKIE